jgi:hypothetical protein
MIQIVADESHTVDFPDPVVESAASIRVFLTCCSGHADRLTKDVAELLGAIPFLNKYDCSLPRSMLQYHVEVLFYRHTITSEAAFTLAANLDHRELAAEVIGQPTPDLAGFACQAYGLPQGVMMAYDNFQTIPHPYLYCLWAAYIAIRFENNDRYFVAHRFYTLLNEKMGLK